MTKSARAPVGAAVACLTLYALCAAPAARAQDRPAASAARPAKEALASRRARGTFDVKLIPQRADTGADAAGHGRMAIDKRFHGDLEGTSRGEMLAVRTAVEGSAGYVALERVRGTLDGRSGSFVLQHSGTMDRGAPRLVIGVVPDSGTDGLAGIAGTMTIEITGGAHHYDFEYTLAGAP